MTEARTREGVKSVFVNIARRSQVVVHRLMEILDTLLAELLDNATSFSPPQSRVQITGNLVGRGVVIELPSETVCGCGYPNPTTAESRQAQPAEPGRDGLIGSA